MERTVFIFDSPRPAMSMCILVAAPQTTEPTKKAKIKTSNMIFRPKRVVRPPQSGRIAVEAIVYAPPAQMKSLPCRCSTIVGSAVDTAVYVVGKGVDD